MVVSVGRLVHIHALQVVSDGRLSRKFHVPSTVHPEASSGCESAGVSLRIPFYCLLNFVASRIHKHSHLQAFLVKHAIIYKYILSYLIKRPTFKVYRRTCETLHTYQKQPPSLDGGNWLRPVCYNFKKQN